MEFNTDVFSLRKSSQTKFDLIGTSLPTSNDVFFRAKQEELVQQYLAARIFMHETETQDWNHWFNPVKDEIAMEAFRLKFRSYFYETALFFYNAVVDISWTLCYVAIEFACSIKGKRVDITGIKPIEEAIEQLRTAEGNVTAPTAEETPFDYLKLMCPEFEPVINQIVEFWLSFSSSDIRKKYNFCKHKGKPSYSELEKYTDGKVLGIYIQNPLNRQLVQMVSTPQDVSYTFSLEDAISELKTFDDDTLFPYIQKLLNTIESILQPSPLIL